jgi:late competence protein required for DNA uptake (superfamily II DNA/RNA helicase)
VNKTLYEIGEDIKHAKKNLTKAIIAATLFLQKAVEKMNKAFTKPTKPIHISRLESLCPYCGKLHELSGIKGKSIFYYCNWCGKSYGIKF